MGIDYNGNMVVGRHYDDLPEEITDTINKDFKGDIYEWAENNNLSIMHQWYDCDEEGMIIGKLVDNTLCKNLDEWFKEVKQMCKEVEKIINIEPMLIGTQNIW